MADDFDPKAFLAETEPAKEAPFDPKAFLAEGAPSQSGFLARTKEIGSQALSSLKEAATEEPEAGAFPSLTRVPRIAGAAAKLAGAPITAAIESAAPYVAGPMASGIQAVGEPLAQKLNPNAVLPSHEEVVRQIEPEVETALGMAVPGKVKGAALPSGARGIAEASERIGVPIPRAAATESVPIQSVAGSIKDIPLVGSPIVKASKAALTGLDQAARDTATAYGSGDQFLAGQAAKQGIQNWIEDQSGQVASKLYNAVDPLVDQTARGPLTNTMKMAQDIIDRNVNASLPEGSAVRLIEDAATNPNGLNYQGIKDLRTRIGELVDTGVLPPDMSKAELARVYGALSQDLRAHVLNNGGANAAKAFDKANSVYAQISDRRKTLSSIIGTKADVAPEGVIDRLLALGGTKNRADITKLTEARRAMGPQAWNGVTSAIINRMGRATPTADFSGDRFVTAWNTLSDNGKRMLFNSTGRTDLAKRVEDIATLSEAHKSLMAYGNPSGSGRTASGAAMAAGIWAEPITALSSVVSSHLLARVLASPITLRQVNAWSGAYKLAQATGTPTRMAVLNGASNNLAHTINAQLGTHFSGKAFMQLLQSPHAAGAEDQQNVPGPPPQKKHGGRIGEKQNPAHGGNMGTFDPSSIGARKAKNNHWFIPDPSRPGKFLQVLPRKRAYAAHHGE